MKIAKTKDKVKKRSTQPQHIYFSVASNHTQGCKFWTEYLKHFQSLSPQEGKTNWQHNYLKSWFIIVLLPHIFLYIQKNSKAKQKTNPHNHVEIIYPVREYRENTHQSSLRNRTTNLISKNNTGFQTSKLKLSAFLQTVFLHQSEGGGKGMKAVLNHPLQRENNKEFRLIIRKNFKLN